MLRMVEVAVRLGCRMCTAAAASALPENPFATEEVEKWQKQLDQGRLKALQEARKEFELYKYVDATLPCRFTIRQLEKLVQLEGRNQRLKYLFYLGKKERMTELDKQRRQEKAEEAAQRRAEALAKRMNNPHLSYTLGGNSIIRRMIDSSMNKINEARLAFAQLYAPSIAFDLAPMRELSSMEADLTWCQLRECYFVNRSHRAPFALTMTDCDKSLSCWRENERYFTGGLEQYTIDVSEKSLCDVFDRRRIVYLSPDSRHMLDKVLPDKVYVIAAMVDRPNRKNWTLAKAKELGMQTACLPLDKYVKWHCGSKSLTLNQVLGILLDVADNGGDWMAAILKHVPKRKLVPKVSDVGKRIRQTNHERMQFMLSMIE